MRKTFNNIAKLIKDKRIEANASQGDWSEELGYKNAQFISNIERGKCGMPYKHFLKLYNMDITEKMLFHAVYADFLDNFKRAFETQEVENNKQEV